MLQGGILATKDFAQRSARVRKTDAIWPYRPRIAGLLQRDVAALTAVIGERSRLI